MGVTTKERVKTALGIKTDEIDDQIDLIIEIVGEFIKRRRNSDFYNEETEETEWPTWLELPAIRLIGFHISKGKPNGGGEGIAAESLGDWSITYDTEYPASALQAIPRRARII